MYLRIKIIKFTKEIRICSKFFKFFKNTTLKKQSLRNWAIIRNFVLNKNY